MQVHWRRQEKNGRLAPPVEKQGRKSGFLGGAHDSADNSREHAATGKAANGISEQSAQCAAVSGHSGKCRAAADAADNATDDPRDVTGRRLLYGRTNGFAANDTGNGLDDDWEKRFHLIPSYGRRLCKPTQGSSPDSSRSQMQRC